MDANTTIFDTPHHRALELLALRELSSGRAQTAFEFADRRCRVSPAPSAHCYLLRAEASHRLGEAAKAILDLDLALEISPQDILANRRMLAWAGGPRQQAAAEAILANDYDIDALRTAMAVLQKRGRRAFASVVVLDDVVEGWAAWSDDGPAELSLTDSLTHVRLTLQPDPFHPLSGPVIKVAEIKLPRAKSHRGQSISISVADHTFFSLWVPGNQAIPAGRASTETRSVDPRVTVIIPVYSGYETTKSCIESLLKALLPSAYTQTILVDDATPDKRIRRYLAHVSRKPGIILLTNPTNLGFVGAVNRAIGHVADGDVVLLNSDTIVPPHFLERLAAAANSAPDVGSATPLSNNGEFMSFPTPNEVNRLGSLEDVVAVDTLAARVNRGRVVDIPSGIGFCLYLTRKSLDRVGGLSNRFHRGYLEDIDLCLRARELGLRSVCATDVYVGHVGSRSFLDEKRRLVVRNLKVLEKSFPKYASECLAFAAIDPLRSFRAAIEQEISLRPGATLLVTGNGVLAAVARERARHLVSKQRCVLICEIRQSAKGPKVALFHPFGEIPQSVVFDLSVESQCDRLLAFIRRIRASRIEFIGQAGIPGDLAKALCGLGITYDIFFAEAGSFGENCELPELSVSPNDLGQVSTGSVARNLPTRQQAWQLEGARQILVPCQQGEAFARRFLPHRDARKLKRIRHHGKARQTSPVEGVDRLGIVPSRTSAYELRLMREIALFMRRVRLRASIVVLGETLDDIGLMRFGNVFVTGAVDAVDLQQLITQYRLDHIFTGLGPPLFGHPIIESAMAYGLPTGYIDWSFGECAPRKRDLAIHPSLSCHDIATALGRWISDQ